MIDPGQPTWVGREIDGRYVVEAVIGVGGMGAVLRAKHKFTGAHVAVKVLRAELQLDPEVQARFLAEAQASNTIGHPAIVRVLDAGRMADGTLYIAMELLVGRSLRDAMTRRDLSADQLMRAFHDLLVVIGHAHGRGFVHRDLKPDNVFLCGPSHEVKLLDFGIAKILSEGQQSGSQTHAGALLGTPAYMAPEQIFDARSVDARADLWAIGVMLYELATARLPLHGETPTQMLGAVAAARMIPIRTYLPQVAPQVEQFFERALAHDPRRRFGAAAELAQALAAIQLPIAHVAPAAGDIAHAATAAVAHAPTAASYVHPQTAASMARSSPAPSFVAAPPPAKKPVLMIAMVAAAAVMVVVVIVIAATRGGGDKSVATTDAPTGPGPKDKRVTDDVPVRKNDHADRCSKACVAAEKCGNYWNCEAQCREEPARMLECLELSKDNCAEGAMCGTKLICDKAGSPIGVPRGNASCAQVLACEGLCGTADVVCGCKCVAQLHPSRVMHIARVNVCGFRCKFEAACVNENCQVPIAACRMN